MMVRVLLVSDMHGEFEHLLKAIDAEQPDVIICAGDWGDPNTVPRELCEQLVRRFHIVTVYGNHDDINLLEELRNTDGTPVLVKNGEVIEVRGIKVTGINGIWAKSKRKPFYVLEEEVISAAQRVASECGDVDVLVTHPCPIGIADMTPKGTHGGQRCFLEAFKLIRPRLYVCGHLHVSQHKQLRDGSIIVNVGYTAKGDYAVAVMGKNECVLERHVMASVDEATNGA